MEADTDADEDEGEAEFDDADDDEFGGGEANLVAGTFMFSTRLLASFTP
jgi:hypothetical protein